MSTTTIGRRRPRLSSAATNRQHEGLSRHPRCKLILTRPGKFSLYAIVLFLLQQGSSSASSQSNNPNNNLPLISINPLETSDTLSVVGSNPLLSNSSTLGTPSKGTDTTADTVSEEIYKDPIEPADGKEVSKKKKKRKKKIPEKSQIKRKISSPSSSKSLSSSQSIFIRRIQREWKDSVAMGIAYDWVNQKPIHSKKKKKKKKELGEEVSANDEPAALTNDNSKNLHICLGPLGSNLFEWHFSIQGLEGSQYDGGIYHGRLILPPQYPASPPRVQVWTPSGRFVPLADICLSASAYHPESWKPSAWNLRTIIESLRLHFITPAIEIGGMTEPPEKRQQLAKESRDWKASFVVAASKKKDKEIKVVTVDHAKMIRQGLFITTLEGPIGNTSTTANIDAPPMENVAAGSAPENPVDKTVDQDQHNTANVHIDEQATLAAMAESPLEQELTQAGTMKTKTKKRHRSKRKPETKVVEQEKPSQVLAATITKFLNTPHVRLVLALLLIYKVVFGGQQ